MLGVSSSDGASTTGVPGKTVDLTVESDEFSGDLKKLLPSAASKLNYLAKKRPGIQRASKEVCRLVTEPNSDVCEQLARVAKYARKTRNFGFWSPK
eukprot:13992254-Alexandrium_andersonii.AAC.1